MVVFALTLVRHAETDYNSRSVIQGQVDVPLSETGHKQAKLLAIRLQNQKYSHIFASDLLRAFQTAESVLAENLHTTVSIVKDKLLRERKFGNVEGKPFKFLQEEAKKSNQTLTTFTPPGGETLKQVYHRAISFFNDLCKDIMEANSVQHNAGHEAKRQKCDDVPTLPDDSANFELNTKNDCDTYNLKAAECANDADDPTPDSSVTSIPNDADRLSANHSTNKNKMDKYDFNSNLPNNSCRTKRNEHKQFVLSFSDSSIRSHIHKSSCSQMSRGDECPNVSLSPLIEKQVSPFAAADSSKMQHLCSTRKISVDSCDDDDPPPAIAANILIVSHGALLRELLRYFVDELDCAVPGGKAQALRTSPNTGVSRFTVSVQSSDDQIRVTCLEIHDKDHLNGVNVT